nr:hypothetical protein [Streptomyces sp. YSPA8]
MVHDRKRDRVGEFHGVAEGGWILRPPGGGAEWTAAPDETEPAGTYDRLRALTRADETTRRAHRR